MKVHVMLVSFPGFLQKDIRFFLDTHTPTRQTLSCNTSYVDLPTQNDTMASILRQKRAAVEVALRRNRESTYTDPVMKKGEHKSAEEIADIKAYLSHFYRTIYKRSVECQTVLREHPNTVAVHYANLVPKQISYEDFWQRYFLRCDETRVVAELDRAASKAKTMRAARVEEIQRSLQNSLRNIQETFEVAATGGVNAPADIDSNHHVASPPKESFLPPILGPDAPDARPLVMPKRKEAEVAIAEVKTDSKAKALSGGVSPAPKTAAGEMTGEKKPVTDDTLTLAPAAPIEESSTEKPRTLQEMVAEANEVERNSPRSRQVRVVSPKAEPKVISFWKSGDEEDLSIPNLLKEGAAKVDVSSSKVLDRDEDSVPKKERIEDRPITEKDARQIGDKSLLNESVILLLLPALIAVVLALLFNSDLACAAIKPGSELSNENLSSEAPFWVPEFKKDVFALICPGRTRTSLEWTPMGSGQGKMELWRLTLRDLDALEGGDNRPLYDKRNLRSGSVSFTFISVVSKKDIEEKVDAPWVL